MSGNSSYPKEPSVGPSDEALQRARFALRNQRSEDAERIARDVLRANPGHAQALNILGYALLIQGRATDAIEILEPAARNLRDPEIDTQLALALRQAGRDEDAIARLRRAAKGQPPFPPAFYELGSLLFAMKRYDEAVEVLTSGLETAPTPESAIQLGHVFLALRDYAGAKATFSKTLALAPNAAGALWGMGKVHQEMGDHPTAIEYFRRCLMHAPNDIGTLLNLGHSLLAVGNLDAGYESFRTAARGDRKRYATALTTLVKLGRGRFWIKPSAAARFLTGQDNQN
jgi:tetratricopeptide (TPR) repeat protein